MPKMKIDGIEIEVPAGITVLQACELAGVGFTLLLPRAPVDRRHCRMCLVEQEKAPKPSPRAPCRWPRAW